MLKLSRISGKWLMLEAILVKWHPSELFVEIKACCVLEMGPSRVAFRALGLRSANQLLGLFLNCPMSSYLIVVVETDTALRVLQ